MLAKKNVRIFIITLSFLTLISWKDVAWTDSCPTTPNKLQPRSLFTLLNERDTYPPLISGYLVRELTRFERLPAYHHPDYMRDVARDVADKLTTDAGIPENMIQIVPSPKNGDVRIYIHGQHETYIIRYYNNSIPKTQNPGSSYDIVSDAEIGRYLFRQILRVKGEEIQEQSVQPSGPEDIIGDEWVNYSRGALEKLREKYKSILQDEDALRILEQSFEIILLDYVEYSLVPAKDKEAFLKRLRNEADEFKTDDEERYKRALATVCFLREALDFDRLDPVRFDFFLEHNPIFDDKAFEYFCLNKELDYDNAKRIGEEIEKGFYFTIPSPPVSQFHQVLVEPDGHKIIREYRILKREDPVLLKAYLADLASHRFPYGAEDMRRILEAASYAVTNDLKLADDFIFGIVPIVKASRIQIGDTDFIQVYVTHLLNSRNLRKHYFAVRKLLGVIPCQRRRGGINELRVVLARIDDGRQRKKDIFRYMRIIQHRSPSVTFRDFVRDLFWALFNGNVEEFLRNTLDKEAQELFVTQEQLDKFKAWKSQIKEIEAEARRLYRTKDIFGLLELSNSELNNILTKVSFIDEDNRRDWVDLVEIWCAARDAYSTRAHSVTRPQDPKTIIKGAQEKRRILLDKIAMPVDELYISADYYDRRHMGQFSTTYDGYLGIDAEYKEGKFDDFIKQELLRAESETALDTLLIRLEDKLRDGEKVENLGNLISELKEVLDYCIRELELCGMAIESFMRISAALKEPLSLDQLDDVVDSIDSEMMGITDFTDLSFRNACKTVGDNIFLDRILKPYRLAGELTLTAEDRRRIAEEKLIGDILADEVSFTLTNRAIYALQKAIKQYKERPGQAFVAPHEKDIKAISLQAEEPILPHRNGSKASRLQQLTKAGLDVPRGVSLTALGGNEALARIEEIKTLVKESIGTIERESDSQFPFNTRGLDPTKKVLTVSVRSGSFISMPGILNSVLNVGLNDEVVDFIIRQKVTDERFVLDAYRRFLNYYGESVLCMKDELFIDVIDAMKRQKGRPQMSISEFSADDLRLLSNEYKRLIYLTAQGLNDVVRLYQTEEENTDRIIDILSALSEYVDLDKLLLNPNITRILKERPLDKVEVNRIVSEAMPWVSQIFAGEIVRRKAGNYEFVQKPFDTLINTVLAIYHSWDMPDAVAYRKPLEISNLWGTGVLIQEMAFGNMNEESGTAVVFTHDPQTREAVMKGDYKAQSQGEDLVSGRTIHTLSIPEELRDSKPVLFARIAEVKDKILSIFRIPQDIELTIESGRVKVLQTRNLNIVGSTNQIMPTNQIPIAEGEGQSGGALWARFVFIEPDIQATKKKIRLLKQEMGKRQENEIKIVLVSYYLAPKEAILLIDDDLEGAICVVKGGSAHATLVARKNRKLLISSVPDIDIEEGRCFIRGEEIREGLEGEIYTLDGNSKKVSPNGGKIFKGMLDCTNQDKAHLKKANMDPITPEAVVSNIEAVAPRLVDSLISASKKKEEVVLALDTDLGVGEMNRLVKELMAIIPTLENNNEELKRFLNNLIIIRGSGKQLGSRLHNITTAQKGAINKENVIVVTKSSNEKYFTELKEKAVIASVDDSKLSGNDYLPLLEIMLFAVGKYLSWDDVALLKAYKLIPNALSLSDLTPADYKMLFERDIKTVVIHLIPNAARLDKELVNVMEKIKGILRNA